MISRVAFLRFHTASCLRAPAAFTAGLYSMSKHFSNVAKFSFILNVQGKRSRKYTLNVSKKSPEKCK